jgi:hypothetical protein
MEKYAMILASCAFCLRANHVSAPPPMYRSKAPVTEAYAPMNVSLSRSGSHFAGSTLMSNWTGLRYIAQATESMASNSIWARGFQVHQRLYARS